MPCGDGPRLPALSAHFSALLRLAIIIVGPWYRIAARDKHKLILTTTSSVETC